MMAKTRQPVRIDWQGVPGPIAGMLRDAGIRSSVGSPVLVDGRLWGAFALHSSDSNPFPLDSESRLEAFAELIAIAISNIEARAELAASRARIVEAADGERRRVVRDLHDGAQQRLVHTIVTVKRGQLALDNGSESETRALFAEALDHAQQATQELRELAHGLLPAVLAYGGLRAAVQELASRTPLPVETRIFADRLPARVEATAYFVIAEALTNIAKHSGARRATIRGSVERSTVYLEVRDDGVGGARPDGSGLLGLADRLGALGGRLRIESPSHGGTLIACELPLPTSARGGSAPAHGPGAEPPVPRQRPRGASHDSSVTARAQSASGVWRGRAR
jgi:signal transduction histidine kinase